MNLLFDSIVLATLGYLTASVWEFVCKHIFHKESLILRGYRLHHSLFGVILFVCGFLFLVVHRPDIALILLMLGLGILLQHTVTDGFKFVTKE